MQLGSYTLQPHQQKAVAQIKSGLSRGIILYFATGAGKTMTSIAAAQSLMAADPHLSVVVVAPASLLTNFKNELLKYGVSPKAYALFSLQGFVKEYDFRSRDLDKVKKLTDRILIVDEAHNLRNSSSAMSQVVVRAAASASRVILLTGTPIQNRPSDIAPLLCMIKPNCVPVSQSGFEERFGQSGLQANTSALKQALRCTVSHYRPVDNSENYATLNIREVLVPMHPVQIKAHLHAVKHLPPVDLDGLAKSKNLMAFLNGPRRMCNLVRVGGQVYASKLQEAVRRVIVGVQNGQKSIIFSSFLECGVDVVKDLLQQHHTSYCVITGEQSHEAKEKARMDYNNGKVLVLIFSRAGGEGISLTDTSFVHIIDATWHDAQAQQVIGRSRRWGSHSKKGSHIIVYKYISVIPRKAEKGQAFNPTTKSIGTPRPLELLSADQILARLAARKEDVNRRFLKSCVAWGSRC